MPRAKQASKRKAGIKAVPVLSAAGLSLSLVGGASATTSRPAADMPTMKNTTQGHEIILGEEEISDVSLATFYVFDKENSGTLQGGMLQLARGGGGGGCGGCGHGGGGGCGGCRGGGIGGGGIGGGGIGGCRGGGVGGCRGGGIGGCRGGGFGGCRACGFGGCGFGGCGWGCGGCGCTCCLSWGGCGPC
jgi:hypothetical protein